MKMNYVAKFKVHGENRFPFDMLRYDRCHPSRAEDVGNIGSMEGLPREVELITYSPIKTPAIRTLRWESFGWVVTTIEVTSLSDSRVGWRTVFPAPVRITKLKH
jgi:hypothetical protein